MKSDWTGKLWSCKRASDQRRLLVIRIHGEEAQSMSAQIWISAGKLPVELLKPWARASVSLSKAPPPSRAKSGSPVALLSQGDVTRWRREDIISPIFSSLLCISAITYGTLFFYPPLPPSFPFFPPKDNFLSCIYSFFSLFPEASIVASLLLWSFSFGYLAHWIQSHIWYYLP